MVLPHSAHVYDAADAEKILLPRIAAAFNEQGRSRSKIPSEDSLAAIVTDHEDAVAEGSLRSAHGAGAAGGGAQQQPWTLGESREDARAFARATEVREAALQDHAITLAGGEKHDNGANLISSLPQLASMAALGKRWETPRAGRAKFWPIGQKAPSLATADNALEFQVRTAVFFQEPCCVVRKVLGVEFFKQGSWYNYQRRWNTKCSSRKKQLAIPQYDLSLSSLTPLLSVRQIVFPQTVGVFVRSYCLLPRIVSISSIWGASTTRIPRSSRASP